MYFLKPKSIDKLNRILGLPSHGSEQDWEIEMADPNRSLEFVKRLHDQELSEEDQRALFSLALCSLEEKANTEGGISRSEWAECENELVACSKNFPDVWQYWITESLEEGEFSIASTLRTIETASRSNKQ